MTEIVPVVRTWRNTKGETRYQPGVSVDGENYFAFGDRQGYELHHASVLRLDNNALLFASLGTALERASEYADTQLVDQFHPTIRLDWE